MTVKLGTRLPKHERNGLGSILLDLLREPYKQHVAIVILDTGKITRDLENEDVIPTARIRAIEPVRGGVDVGELRRILLRAYEDRTGQVELPADWEAVLASMADGDGVVGGGDAP